MNFEFTVTPDGGELAYASGSPVPSGAGTPYGQATPGPGSSESLIVQNVATGARRTCSAWRSADAVLNGAFDAAW